VAHFNALPVEWNVFGVRHEYLLIAVHRIEKVKQQSAQWLYPGNAGLVQRFRSNRHVRAFHALSLLK
jgi:hypothetical protein